MNAFDEAGARHLVQSAIVARNAGANETVVRQTIVAGLQDAFPRSMRPWWVDRHIVGAEFSVQFSESDRRRRGAVDSVVGLTAIEYEPDLRGPRFATGKHQVQQYCAGMLNEGADPGAVRGVLSDGVDWYAYAVQVPAGLADYAVEDVVLVEIDRLQLTVADDASAAQLMAFLHTHLGQPEVRPLTAASVASYLGVESAFGSAQIARVRLVVDKAQQESPKQADLVAQLWARLAGFLDASADEIAFSPQAYIFELYLEVLAKLICANIVVGRAVSSDNAQLDDILSGDFFDDRGLKRFVEHDYFGWLHKDFPELVRPIAKAVQEDLRAYDFTAVPDEDLFGQMMAELSGATHRALLGQEWTPSWLARRMAAELIAALPRGQEPHFVDVCAGSGAMVVEVARATQSMLRSRGLLPGSDEALRVLERACVGFDIDPLAVMLAKVNWVAGNREWLGPMDGSRVVSVPVYHADSLFTLLPVDDDPDFVTLDLIDSVSVRLPRALLTSAHQASFDILLDGAYDLASMLAGMPASTTLSGGAVDALIQRAGLGDEHQVERIVGVRSFVETLVQALASLERADRNGIWIFVLRNAYRPGLVSGQFNGLISNPPWMAMSRIGRNPLAAALKRLAERYGLTPDGSSFLHLELATTFLAHACDHYLMEGARVICVLPGTVVNGTHHAPFRNQILGHTKVCIELKPSALWLIEKGTFKNLAVVLLAERAHPTPCSSMPGLEMSRGLETSVEVSSVEVGGRRVLQVAGESRTAVENYGKLSHQGADLMPRTLLLVSATAHGDQTTIEAVARDGAERFLISKAKACADFRPVKRTLPKCYVHGALLSQHVAPFLVADPSRMVLPFERIDGTWRVIDEQTIGSNRSAARHFADVHKAAPKWSTTDQMWEVLDYRGKLAAQVFPEDAWVVLIGAGGEIPAAAAVSAPFLTDVVIDQTLYWLAVDTEDEALYVVALLNSPRLREALEGVIPEGEFGGRHLHTVPLSLVPRYDSANALHLKVVAATRSLIEDLKDASTNQPELARLLTIEIDMKIRRSRIRQALASCESYAAYVEAVGAVI